MEAKGSGLRWREMVSDSLIFGGPFAKDFFQRQGIDNRPPQCFLLGRFGVS
jgi:hypothetical protein